MFNDTFYPTPAEVANTMIDIVMRHGRPGASLNNFLEPSAGKGDIADIIKTRFNGRYREVKIDTIEYDPALASILQGKGYSVIGDDWLDYRGVCYYDCILMNPPFDTGAKHLLKAWEFMFDGQIVCLLNAETVNNPYSAERKLLVDIIEKNGSIHDLGQCFIDAERKTKVPVVAVYLNKLSKDDIADLWETKGQEKDYKDIDETDSQGMPLAIIDTLGNLEHYYTKGNDLVIAGMQQIVKGLHLSKLAGGGIASSDFEKLMGLLYSGQTNSAMCQWISLTREEAWKSVFEKLDFRKWLDQKQRNQFIRDIELGKDVAFTKENIKGTLANVFSQRNNLFEQSVANIFEQLTKFHKDNSYHHEGWKTNDNYKINKKIIFPYGCQYDKKWGTGFSMSYYSSFDIYQDLDRVLCVMANKDFDKIQKVGDSMREAFKAKGKEQNICESEFFNIRYFKKGTVWLTFKDLALLDQFNIKAAAGRMWLGKET